MSVIKPYDDTFMTYDKDRGVYVLTKEFVNSQLGNTFLDDGILKRRLEKNSRVVYNYIHKAGNGMNRPIVDFILNQTTQGRQFIFDILSAQMEADLKYGNNSLGDIPRINIKSGVLLDKEAMADDILCQYAKDIIEDSIGRLGLNIVYSAKYPPMIWLKYREYLK